MNDFKRQLEEDFNEYRLKYPNIQHIEKDEWAFNFWVLDKLFTVEEEIIEDLIVDYNDKGIDCFVWHEDTRDLYLIQNKYYSEGTPVTKDYLMNDFLTRAIGALERGTYTRSAELQRIYNKFHDDEDFCINFHMYVTNNTAKTQELTDALAEFNHRFADKKYTAKMFSLEEIEEAYYGEPIRERHNFSFTISTINRGTELQINNEAYRMTQALDAKYVLTPVLNLYNMVKLAKEKKYPLFDENIREYLGSGGTINKAIKRTLESPEDRRNFFFYNNGITMIVNEIGSSEQRGGMRIFEVDSPQIVNGCQTVSTIYETLSNWREEILEEEFKDTYVMLKILKIPSNDASLKALYRNIVTYNNSQNAIDEKSFVAISDVFKRVQTELEGKGILLCIKQSDNHSFSQKYTSPTVLRDRNSTFMLQFGLDDLTTRAQFTVNLEKFLQVILSFADNPQNAVQHKSKLLVLDSRENEIVVDFIKKPTVTSNDYLLLYLLYLRAEKEKRTSEDGKNPNAFYLVYCFSEYECMHDEKKIYEMLSDKEKVDRVIRKYTLAIQLYYSKWKDANPGKEYNDMIKAQLDKTLLNKSVEEAEMMMMQLERMMNG